MLRVGREKPQARPLSDSDCGSSEMRHRKKQRSGRQVYVQSIHPQGLTPKGLATSRKQVYVHSKPCYYRTVQKHVSHSDAK